MSPRTDAGDPTDPAASGGKSLTIGAVCKQLEREFPDISISKIRYLEDQKLLNPRRTAGGYRLFSPTDVTRLRTILRLQRDEFLPLRVIRQELAAGRADSDAPQTSAPEPRPAARRGSFPRLRTRMKPAPAAAATAAPSTKPRASAEAT